MSSTYVNENNIAEINGVIVEPLNFSHEVYGEKFYKSFVEVKRKSDVTDIIPFIISDRIIDCSEDWVDQEVNLKGQFRSYNSHIEGAQRAKLELSFFVQDFSTDVDGNPDKNLISIHGFLCKDPNYRTTPLKRSICDLLVAVNRPYGKSDYIPCICWGRNALFASSLSVGTEIIAEGRIQSRNYTKTFADGTSEDRTAYEVSISKVDVVEPGSDFADADE